jgi:hypothetical protein
MTDQVTQTPEAAPQAPGVQLQLADLVLATQVIQLASQRGAFKIEEFAQVGGLHERLVAFLQASNALQPAGDQTA